MRRADSLYAGNSVEGMQLAVDDNCDDLDWTSVRRMEIVL